MDSYNEQFSAKTTKKDEGNFASWLCCFPSPFPVVVRFTPKVGTPGEGQCTSNFLRVSVTAAAGVHHSEGG
ncbi:hypothetical protein GLAREA_11107 [Glarea lozoyensis ATCC 20868]|uniref:Uncharacterized protein n=1 Tax=Glarea lozoyensis (strain ATCC 20868 / MF5171) TaxID=1116229 RepID=S3EAR0_GLAL2|nr:uncharacterized protein GLAREA_11107 [Glarea lozoyensis ATCC 20868]EPE35408.1 hypothetical protein GLAREA_11107 [Glarea lozoyensis ATCC 20868]